MIRILQRIWEWLIRTACMGLLEDRPKQVAEADILDEYGRKIEQFKASVRCILAEHYRVCLLLENEKKKTSDNQQIEETTQGDEANSKFAHNRLFSGQTRVEYLQDRALSTKQEADKALKQLHLLQNELTNATIQLHNAQAARRAAEMQLAAENWRLESELGLNKGLEGLRKMEQETRDTELKAKLASETNDLLFGESGKQSLKE